MRLFSFNHPIKIEVNQAINFFDFTEEPDEHYKLHGLFFHLLQKYIPNRLISNEDECTERKYTKLIHSYCYIWMGKSIVGAFHASFRYCYIALRQNGNSLMAVTSWQWKNIFTNQPNKDNVWRLTFSSKRNIFLPLESITFPVPSSVKAPLEQAINQTSAPGELRSKWEKTNKQKSF